MEYKDILKTLVCRYCGYKNQPPDYVATPHLIHQGKVVCHDCKRQLDWVAKPENDTKNAKRPSAHKALVKRKQPDIRYCEMCLRLECSLPDKVVLHGHHVLEYADNGEAMAINTLVACTECHDLIHWRRRFAEGRKINDDETTFVKATDQQRAVRDARDSSVDLLEARRAFWKANQGSVSDNGSASKLDGPKHVGELLPGDPGDAPF